MLGRNVQMVSFKLASSQEVFFAGASAKDQLVPILRPMKTAHVRVPGIAILIKAQM